MSTFAGFCAISELDQRQRRLLEQLLKAHTPISAAELGTSLRLSSRQVQYSLRGCAKWLQTYHLALQSRPGIGVFVEGNKEQKLAALRALRQNLSSPSVLSDEQRQKLLTLYLLAAYEPVIVRQLQRISHASRRAITADLEIIANWLAGMGLSLQKRRNYGVWVSGEEKDRRQAIAALLWGEFPGTDNSITISYHKGISFDRSSLPDCQLVQATSQMLARIEMQTALRYVARAESQIGGRFTDEGALALALKFAIQSDRIRQGQSIELPDDVLSWVIELPIWETAMALGYRLSWSTGHSWPPAEIAMVAIELMAAPRSELWPGDGAAEPRFVSLIDAFLREVAEIYQQPELAQDGTLRESLLVQVVPAYYRQRFNLWFPSTSSEMRLSADYAREYALAQRLHTQVKDLTGTSLAEADICNIALLLRAAYIREQPHYSYRILLVCPSGMATSQLLMARIKVRFPHLQHIEILSVRDLYKRRLSDADLLLTTIPLQQELPPTLDVIQVHPLLLPEDVEAITQWLAKHRQI